MKYEWFFDWLFCFGFPLLLYAMFDIKLASFYVGCLIASSLIRIGNILR